MTQATEAIATMWIIDLSAPVPTDLPGAAPFEGVELRDTSYAAGAARAQALFGVPPGLLRHGEG